MRPTMWSTAPPSGVLPDDGFKANPANLETAISINLPTGLLA